MSAPALGATASWEFDTPSYNFGPMPYGSGPGEPHEFTLTNTGETPLVAKAVGYRWSFVAAWEKDGPPFRVTSSDCRNRTLEPSESCFVDVAADPHHQGFWSGAVSVKDQGEEVPVASVKLSGEGSGPALPVRPDHLEFGPIAIGTTSSPQTITVEEQSVLYGYWIDSAGFGGFPAKPTSGPFQIVGNTCRELSLTPGATCTVEVVMAPTEAGTFQAELEIENRAPEGRRTVRIEGTAIVAPPVVDQPSDPGDGIAGITSSPAPLIPAQPMKRSCPKGKRWIVKKGRRICIKKRGRSQHGSHAPRH